MTDRSSKEKLFDNDDLLLEVVLLLLSALRILGGMPRRYLCSQLSRPEAPYNVRRKA